MAAGRVDFVDAEFSSNSSIVTVAIVVPVLIMSNAEYKHELWNRTIKSLIGRWHLLLRRD